MKADTGESDRKQSINTSGFNVLEKKKNPGWAHVALPCNPSYSGGRDQEDHGLRPAEAKSL
jgi:hypothetical protein